MTQSAGTKRIKVTFETSNPEGDVIDQGFEDAEGRAFDNVLEAATWLTDEGAIFPSASDAKGTIWFTSEDDTDFTTGQATRRSFHPIGFTQNELNSLFFAVSQGKSLGNPMVLDKAMVDDFETYARTFRVNDDGIITDATDKKLVGYHQAVAYIEKFAGPVISNQLKASLAREAEVATEDFFPGQTFIELAARDAIYFGLTDRPILVSTITADSTVSHQFLSRAEIRAQAEEMKADGVNRTFGR
ncbi:hypothetical protein [Rhizobium sp. MHM7A]|uniref:hypothetical protein n=1 Tax=Rhizobium sp. MHM7A TaxID=2583233 RepID=UPI00110681F6|nr:hypothetical protein [Rhizobium sp. MHM7A]TLX16280.1 hypothetical protein FFR93_02830 [Rhizobium sp. MHM7A]